MPNDKCPKCGAERDGIHVSPHYLCESGYEGHGLEQSDHCRTRCAGVAEIMEIIGGANNG